jgi:RNA polymerase sigma-70 factor (ECF subfamily)
MSGEFAALQLNNNDPSGMDEFQRLTDPYQHELLVHCYRFFGSLEEAEDALQETWLRAWRRIGTLKDQSALRAWLYKIATNVCLDMLDKHKARCLPNLTYLPADPRQPLPPPVGEATWIEPLPEEYLDWSNLNPEARIELHESVNLAFLTVLQLLPGRQRAVLILRDVLGWKAQETAELLSVSVPAVNSALQRARGTLKKHQRGQAANDRLSGANEQTETLLNRYVQAWETADAAGLVSLLREDAVWVMPPLPAWFRGRAVIEEFLQGQLFAGRNPGDVRLEARRANGCPAFATYQLDESGVYRIGAFQILNIEQGMIAQIVSFLSPGRRLIDRLKLPAFLDR